MNRNIIYIVSTILAMFVGVQAYAVTLPTTSYQPMSASSSAPAPSFTASSMNNLPMQSYSSASSDYPDCRATGPNDVDTCPTCCFKYLQACMNPGGGQPPKTYLECMPVYNECQSVCGGAHSLPIPDAVPYLLALSAAYAAVLYAKKRKEQQA